MFSHTVVIVFIQNGWFVFFLQVVVVQITLGEIFCNTVVLHEICLQAV